MGYILSIFFTNCSHCLERNFRSGTSTTETSEEDPKEATEVENVLWTTEAPGLEIDGSELDNFVKEFNSPDVTEDSRQAEATTKPEPAVVFYEEQVTILRISISVEKLFGWLFKS
jgi:hypothetical protein